MIFLSITIEQNKHMEIIGSFASMKSRVTGTFREQNVSYVSLWRKPTKRDISLNLVA